jgi:hypothetical protein
MSMLAMIRERMRSGVERLRWYASIIGERLKAEISLISLLREAEDMNIMREEAARSIGHRVFELRESGGNVYEDAHVAAALEDMEALETQIEELREGANLLGEVGEE